MRAVAVLLLPALAALAFVGALTLVTGGPKPVETQSFVWKKRVFKNKQQFARWLNRRDVTYAQWAARHPGASPPWERKSDDDGLGAFTLLAALLGGIAAVVGFMRIAASRSARRAFRSLLARTGFEPAPLAQAGVSVRSAISAYGLWTPPRSERPRDPERPELVLVEEPPATPAAVDEAKAVAVAVEPRGDPPVVAARKPKAADKPAPKRPRRPARRPKKAAVARPESAAPAEEPAGGEPKVEETAPAPEPPSVDAYQPAVPPAFPSREVVCEVAFWRGYLNGQFYAHLRDDDPLSALATSPMFRCRSASPEETEECVGAFAALHDLLVADGWEPDGNGGAWYARRFTRHVPA